MDLMIDLPALHAAYEPLLGKPAKVLPFRRRTPDAAMPGELDVLIFQPRDYSRLPDDKCFTFLATAGISSLPLPETGRRVELVVRVDGRQPEEGLEALGRTLADLAILPFRENFSWLPDLVLYDLRLPLFERMDCGLITSWPIPSETRLPGLPLPVPVLSLYPIFENEIGFIRRSGTLHAYRSALRQGINWYDPRRPPAVPEPAPDSPPPMERSPTVVESSAKPAVESVWNDIESYLQANAPEAHQALPAGASQEEIDSLEAGTGARLPEEYKASLKRHNGKARVQHYRLLSAADALSSWSSMRKLSDQGTFAANEVVYGEGGEFQNTWWHPGWIPVAEDSGGNLILVDTAPAERGTQGQIIQWDTVEGPSLARQKTFLSWLESYRDDLQAGKYKVDESGILVRK